MSKQAGICSLCRKTRDLAHSHIVPEFIYAPLYDEDPRRFRSVIETDKRVKSKFLQSGIREHLLCLCCEKFLNEYYEQKSLRTWQALSGEHPNSGLKLQEKLDPQGGRELIVEGHDYASFKLLLLSILWRASVSKLPTYSLVDLGPHEEILREMILDQKPGAECEYPVILYMLDDPDLGNIPPPYQGSLKGHRVYQFLLVRVLVMIVVTSHLKQETFFGYALKESSPLRIPIVRGSELPVIKEAMKMWRKARFRTD